MKQIRPSVLPFYLQMLALVVFVLCSICYANPIRAQIVSPLQTGHYMPGFMNIRDYADPSPVSGIMVLDYGAYQWGNKFYGRNGNEVTQITGPLGNKVNLDLDINGYYNTPMVLWVAKKKVLGATYFGGAAIPIVTVSPNLAFSLLSDIDSFHKSGEISGTASGFSDLNLLPVFLCWGHKKFDITAGCIVYAPTGRFELGGDNNTGLGYWSTALQLFGYGYPLKVKGQDSKALALMLGGTLELIGDIKDTDVSPGRRFSLEYGVSQYMTERIELGIYGGNNWQIGRDNGQQVFWNRSIKDRLSVLGFQAGYWVWKQRLQAIGKYSFNYGAVQRFQQNTVMLNLIFITNALTGNKKAKETAK